MPFAKRTLASTVLLVVAWAASPSVARSQVVTGGDFDICDFCGSLVGNTARVVGRPGFGTSSGLFVLINAANDAQDVDHDGYTVGVHFTNLFVSDTADFVNEADATRLIQRRNLVIADFLNPLNNGFQNRVNFFVNIPEGTPAGTYRGNFIIRDAANPIGQNPNGESIRIDFVTVEVEVLAVRDLALVRADTAARADSVVLRGRPGETVNGVVRVANIGNIPLTNVSLEATDLVATSGTGLRVRSDRISFSPTALTTIPLGDTARVTITIRIPLGILAGAYRGDLIVQADQLDERRIPLTLIVTTPGDIVFDNNPVRGSENAVIIFNADPGTDFEIRIFDMMGLLTYAENGRVFAGVAAPGGGVSIAGDEAVRRTWSLTNGRGEPVAGGIYYVVVNAVQAGARRQLRKKLMVIR